MFKDFQNIVRQKLETRPIESQEKKLLEMALSKFSAQLQEKERDLNSNKFEENSIRYALDSEVVDFIQKMLDAHSMKDDIISLSKPLIIFNERIEKMLQ